MVVAEEAEEQSGTRSAESLKVAIVGSGPAGFYSADFLLRDPRNVAVDVVERLPTPFGLVRFGVAPDHQGIKRVSAAFERIAKNPRFRFFGNVEIGRDLTLETLLAGYHAVIFAVGSATDKRMGIAGEDLPGSDAATSFVGWYNGHPDFQDRTFDLTSERVVVIGMGNVAMDVARVLVRRPEELADTDITEAALAALRESRVREVVLLGRRGPAQGAFDQAELADIAALPGVDVIIEGELPALDLAGFPTNVRKNVEYLRELAARPPRGASRRVRMRFLASPAEVLGGDRVRALRIEQNQLVEAEDGSVVARGTGVFETLECGLVLRSIGYRGVALPGAPFDTKRGLIPNDGARVLGTDGKPVHGLYAVGWIKRGPSGLIGTNKSCAKDTVTALLSDTDSLLARPRASAQDLAELLANAGTRAVTFADWQRLDAIEVARGKAAGKVREKLVNVRAMLDALDKS
jgi:ferredoxin--NADP+ reductase